VLNQVLFISSLIVESSRVNSKFSKLSYCLNGDLRDGYDYYDSDICSCLESC